MTHEGDEFGKLHGHHAGSSCCFGVEVVPLVVEG